MSPEHHDDLGRRLQVLERWEPVTPTDDAWTRVVLRRRARGMQRALIMLPVLLAIVGVGAWLARDRSDKTVTVTAGPPTTLPDDASARPVARPLPIAPADGSLRLEPAGPYTAGQRVRLLMAETIVGDWGNATPRLCFAWGAGETCDPTAWQWDTHGSARRTGPDIVWELALPGWVVTPAGPRPCATVGCRVEFEKRDNATVGTPVLDIEAGERPADPPVTLTEVRADGTLDLAIAGLHADESWLRAHDEHPESAAQIEPVALGLCVFDANGWACDGLYDAPALPFDGLPSSLTIAPRRELFTPDGWEDCARFTCVVSVSRAVGVFVDPPGNIGSGGEIVAWLPYRLADTVEPDPRPELLVTTPGPLTVGATVTVELRHPPTTPERMQLGQCSSADLTVIDDCRYELNGWERLDDGSLRATHTVLACAKGARCYLAVTGAGKGYPAIATVELDVEAT